MTLGLDLAWSHAKVNRAEAHIDTLKRELPIVIKQSPPYTVRVRQIDADGWCSIYLSPTDPKVRLPLSVIVGDIYHNLRCALDYIVTALAVASDTPPTTRHQFPIFKDATIYKADVGFPTPKPHGQLGGIKHCLDLIESLQPYHTKPDPDGSGLWRTHRFSNQDKHRAIIAAFVVPLQGYGSIQLRTDGRIIRQRRPPPPPLWKQDEDIEFMRVQFAKPFPTKYQTSGKGRPRLWFAVEPLKGETEGLAHPPSELAPLCEMVRATVELFEKV